MLNIDETKFHTVNRERFHDFLKDYKGRLIQKLCFEYTIFSDFSKGEKVVAYCYLKSDPDGCNVVYKVRIQIHEQLFLCKLNAATVKPVYFVCPMDGGWDDKESTEYWVNESTCPANLLNMMVIEGEDCDPHGLLELIEIADRPDDWDDCRYDDVEKLAKIFKHFQKIVEHKNKMGDLSRESFKMMHSMSRQCGFITDDKQ